MVGFFSTVIKISTNLVALVGCHGDMVTMGTVNGYLFLYSYKGITSKFRKFFFLASKFFIQTVKVLRKLLTMPTGKIPAIPFFHIIISLNLVHGYNVHH